MPAKAKKPAIKIAKPAAAGTRARRAAPARKVGSIDKHKAQVRRLLEHGLSEASRSNPEALHEYFADHFVDHVRIHHETQGVHGVKEVMGEVHESTPRSACK